MDLALLDRHGHLACARIADHGPELRAQNIVEQHRQIACRSGLGGAGGDGFGLEGVGESLDRRILAHDAEERVLVGAAEIGEFRRVVAKLRGVFEDGPERLCREGRTDECAVLGCDVPTTMVTVLPFQTALRSSAAATGPAHVRTAAIASDVARNMDVSPRGLCCPTQPA